MKVDSLVFDIREDIRIYFWSLDFYFTTLTKPQTKAQAIAAAQINLAICTVSDVPG